MRRLSFSLSISCIIVAATSCFWTFSVILYFLVISCIFLENGQSEDFLENGRGEDLLVNGQSGHFLENGQSGY